MNQIFHFDTFDIQSFLLRVYRNWYWLLLCMSLALAGSWTYLRYTPSIYKVEGTILIKKQENGGFSQNVLMRELGFQEDKKIINEIQLLKSRTLMEKVVRDLNLHITYYTIGKIQTNESYPPPVSLVYAEPLAETIPTKIDILPIDSLSFYLLKKEKHTAEIDTVLHAYNHPFILKEVVYTLKYNYPHQTPIRIEIAKPMSTAQRLGKKLKIVQVKKSDVLKISLEDTTPKKAIKIIQQLVAEYNTSILTDKKEVASNTLEFIEERLKLISRELSEVEQKVEDFRTTKDIPVLLSENANQLLSRINIGDENLATLDLQETILDNISTYLNKSKEEIIDFLPISAEISGSPIAALVVQFNELLVQLKAIQISVHPSDPRVQLLKTQLAELKNNILNGVVVTKQELAVKKIALKENLAPIVMQLNEIPKNERELLQIMRQQKVKESLFLFLLEKREETALTRSSQIADSKVIDQPIIMGLVGPKIRNTYLLFLIASIGLFTGICYIRELTDNLVYNKKDIKSLTDIPFLGILGHAASKEKIVVKPGIRTAIVEMFHLLNTNLHYMLPTNGSPCRTAMVSSGESGEGKTFTTINLGASIALSGSRVLLIDMDLRKPRLSKYIQDKKVVRGVSNYLANEDTKIDDLIHPVDTYNNFYFIGAGPIPPNPTVLLDGKRMDTLFSQLKQRFDFILVDTPPIGLVTDGFLIGRHVKASIIVARFKKTTKHKIQFFDEIFRDKKLKNMGIVLNDAKNTNSYGYSYGGGNSYGYYEIKKKPWLLKKLAKLNIFS